VLSAQAIEIKSNDLAFFDAPLPVHHDPVRAMDAAQYECCEWIMRAREW
jgi:hypothetical protein